MIVEDHLLLWNYASLKIIDVKRVELSIGEQLHTSNLSTSTLFYSIQGRARLVLNEEAHIVENGYVWHAGKGAELSISDVTAHLEYYIIEYKAHLSLPCSNDLLQLLERAEPFSGQYVFAVNLTSPKLTVLSSMLLKWSQPGAMAKLQVKSLFYQFVCELMEQLQHQQIKQVSPDLVIQAVDYINQNYAQPLTVESLAVLLNCSSRTLQRMFKKRLSLGPIDYLLQVRIDKSKELLYLTNTGLKDIALAVGYTDSYYFSRLFKRYTGISPSTYREWMLYSSKDKPKRLADIPLRKEIDPLNAAIRQPLRTLIHLKGELTLELPPKKIAVLDPQFLDHMLALDEQPAGSVMAGSDQCSFPDYLFDKLRTIQTLGTLDDPDLEALHVLAPDMIICTEFHLNIYESLSQIAPTIMLKRNHDWRETLQIFGRIMGKELKAEQVLQQYKHKINRLKSILATKLDGQSVSMIRPRDDNIRLHTCAHRTAEILYRDLGLHPPKQAFDRKRTSSLISLEGLPELNADHYFLLIDNQFQSWSDEIQNTKIWKNLRAVQQHHVYEVKANMWIAYYGPIAMNQVVDQVADIFLNTK